MSLAPSPLVTHMLAACSWAAQTDDHSVQIAEAVRRRLRVNAETNSEATGSGRRWHHLTQIRAIYSTVYSTIFPRSLSRHLSTTTAFEA